MLKIYLIGLAITIWENKWSGIEVDESKCGLLDFLETLDNLHIKKENEVTELLNSKLKPRQPTFQACSLTPLLFLSV